MFRAFIILMLLARASMAGAFEIELTTCEESDVPKCCIKRDDIDYILYYGAKELQRFRYSNGRNVVTPFNPDALHQAFKAMEIMKSSGACR